MFKVGDKVVLTEEAKQKFKTAIRNDPYSGWNKSFEQMVYDDSVGVVTGVIGTQIWLCDGKFYVDCSDIILESTSLAESYNPSEAKPPEVVALDKELKSTDWTDKHYDAFYHLTQKDIERGWIKIDPYRVSKQWRLGAKDESGALFHVLKNKYSREIKPNIFVDVYDVLRAFEVDDPCLSHLAKKALCAGLRGHKDRMEDLLDIKASIERAIDMHKEWNNDGGI